MPALEQREGRRSRRARSAASANDGSAQRRAGASGEGEAHDDPIKDEEPARVHQHRAHHLGGRDLTIATLQVRLDRSDGCTPPIGGARSTERPLHRLCGIRWSASQVHSACKSTPAYEKEGVSCGRGRSCERLSQVLSAGTEAE